MGDRRWEKVDGRQSTGDGRQETEDERQERLETGDVDRRRET